MKTTCLFLVLVTCALILSACQSTQLPATEIAVVEQPTNVPQAIHTRIPTNTPIPSDTTVPTNTVSPTETPKPTNTPLPAGILFRDDFNGELQPGWEWQNENPNKWALTDDGWLQIIGEYDSLLGGHQSNLLWYPLPTGDFVITVHINTKPYENFHQAAIFIYEDPDNYVTINRGYCDVCPTGGNGFYMDYKIGGQWGDYNVATDANNVYLRLESKGDILSGYYATEPEQWNRLGRFGNYFQFKKVGIGVSNCSAADDVIGQFNYFEIALP
jgi:regulation of enolase protein 1 (concanavalin A-like superfamily)